MLTTLVSMYNYDRAHFTVQQTENRPVVPSRKPQRQSTVRIIENLKRVHRESRASISAHRQAKNLVHGQGGNKGASSVFMIENIANDIIKMDKIQQDGLRKKPQTLSIGF